MLTMEELSAMALLRSCLSGLPVASATISTREGLATGHVEGIDEALKHAEGDDFVNGDDFRESECGQGEGLDAGEDLSPD